MQNEERQGKKEVKEGTVFPPPLFFLARTLVKKVHLPFRPFPLLQKSFCDTAVAATTRRPDCGLLAHIFNMWRDLCATHWRLPSHVRDWTARPTTKQREEGAKPLKILR